MAPYSCKSPCSAAANAGHWAGCVKSTIGKWLRRTHGIEGVRVEAWPAISCGCAGRTELRVIYAADTGVALRSFGPWAAVIDRTCSWGRNRRRIW